MDTQSHCINCGLWEYASTVNVGFRGSLNPLFYIVSGTVNAVDDRDGQCLSGRVGRFLDKQLSSADISENYIRYGSIVNCVSWENNDLRDKTRVPSHDEITTCCTYIEIDILESKPVYVVTLGNVALHHFIPDAPNVSKSRGNRYSCQVPSREVIKSKCIEFLSSEGIDTNDVDYETLLEICDGYGYKPRFHKFIVIPILHPEVIFGAGDKFATLEKQFTSDIKFIKSLIPTLEDNEDIDYRVLNTIEEIDEHCKFLIAEYGKGNIDTVVCDTEANQLDSFGDDANLLLLCLCHAEGKSVVIPYNHEGSPFYNDMLALQAISNILNELFAVVPITNHNVKFDIHWLYRIGIEVKRVYNCTYLSAWTLYNETLVSKDLDSLATRFTPLKHHKGELHQALNQLVGLTFDNVGNLRKPNYGDVDIELLSDYCNKDGDATFRLNQIFMDMLHKQKLYDAHYKYSIIPILPVVAMERAGIKFNTEFNNIIKQEYATKINEYYCKLYEYIKKIL